jgi:hypothetical protein
MTLKLKQVTTSGMRGAASIPFPSNVVGSGGITVTKVGSAYTIDFTNQAGAVIGPVSSNDGDFVKFDGTTGKLIKAGSVLTTNLPLPTSTTLGGVKSLAVVAHKFLTLIGTDGLPVAAQPTAADLSNGVTGSGAVVLATSPALTTPTGIVKGDVGLGSVDNTADTGKPVSTIQQTALDLKAPLASPTFSGIVTTAGQIAFPGTQNASAGANTLDDYEEGTWVPVLTFATPGDVAVTYSSARTGVYTKIGRVVTVGYVVDCSAFTRSTASGGLQITGLPFPAANVAFQNTYNCGGFQGITKAGYTQIAARIQANTSLIDFFASGSAQSLSQVVVADVPSGGTPTLFGSVTYVAA